MKRKDKYISNKLKIANRIVFAVLMLIIAVIIIGSLLAMLSQWEKKEAENAQLNVSVSENIQNDEIMEIFTGIGRLRIPLSGKDSATVALTVSFPYQKNDTAFAEELASRLGDFRTIIREYFSVLNIEAVRKLDENAAKNEILNRFNRNLRLGKLETLFFTDFDWY